MAYIGRKTMVVVDPNRRETLSGRDEPRRVVVNDYYPVEAGWQPEKRGLYRDLYAPAWERATDLLTEFGLDKDSFCKIESAVHEGAPRGAREFPVVVLSPAMSIDQQMYQFLIAPFVEAGYRVVTVGATYESMCTVYPDGEFVPHAECVKKSDLSDRNWLRHLVEIRRDDLRLVLDALQLDRVGVVGHSLGGAAVWELARDEERVKAVVLLDASLDLMTLDRSVSTPLLNMRQEADSYEEMRRMTSETAARTYIEAQSRLHQRLNGYKSFVRVRDALHISFCDMLWVYGAHVDWQSVRHVNQAVSRAVISFYDQFLRDQEHAHDRFLLADAGRLGVLPLRL